MNSLGCLFLFIHSLPLVVLALPLYTHCFNYHFSFSLLFKNKYEHDHIQTWLKGAYYHCWWYSAEDSVYVEDEEMIQEYVMNETGRLYVGSKKQITSKPWVFGQFESPVLDVALHLISELPIWIRGNPIKVTRKLSSTVRQQCWWYIDKFTLEV